MLVKNKVLPFLKSAFPGRQSFQLLLDGEKVLRGPAAQREFAAASVKSKMKDWPASSPDLNPQEHVWSWVEPHLRKLENETDGTFERFQTVCVKAVQDYPSSIKLIKSLPSHIKKVFDAKGGPTDK